jgi:Ca2+/H+ antiporter
MGIKLQEMRSNTAGAPDHANFYAFGAALTTHKHKKLFWQSHEPNKRSRKRNGTATIYVAEKQETTKGRKTEGEQIHAQAKKTNAEGTLRRRGRGRGR